MFAAFPGWYATLFSGLYLAVVLLLAALIVRGVSLEYRAKRQAARWRRTWSWLLAGGSLLAPLLIGVALGDLLHGLPINASHEYTGSVANLLPPYGVFAGITFAAVCVLHGATFLALKTAGEVRERARRVARRTAPVAMLVVVAFIAWTHAIGGQGTLLNPVEFATVLVAIAAVWLVHSRSEGWAFTATAVTMAGCVLSIFVDLYPRVMVSTTSPAFDLTVHNTASGRYALTVMTVVAVIFLPFVLVYQAWSYHVFRRRVSQQEFPPTPTPTPAPPGNEPPPGVTRSRSG
jgi:cytochrome d ubiquinol oxidase subunit II